MKRFLTVAALAALTLTTVACSGMTASNAGMTKEQHEAFETGVNGGFKPSNAVLADRAIGKGRPDIAAQYK